MRDAFQNHASTTRFSDRVADYVRYRPGYPKGLVDTLSAEFNIGTSSVVADVGSGTGISSDLFLQLGCETYAVEPNDEMRAAAEARLGSNDLFHSICGTAESTTLEENSMNCVAAGQAFHWFDIDKTRDEFRRILRPNGLVALFWNVRLTKTSGFLAAYEQLLLDFATDYRQVDHRNVGQQTLTAFFAGAFESRTFSNEQRFDFAGLRGRLLSSSYVPNVDHKNHAPMLEQLERIFETYVDQDSVRFEYDTELFIGKLDQPDSQLGILRT